MELTVKQLAERLGAELSGEGTASINCVGPADTDNAGAVTFVTDDKYIDRLKSSAAAAIMTSKKLDGIDKPQLIVGNVNKSLIDALNIFAPELAPAEKGIHPTAVVADSAVISPSASVGAFVRIADGVTIGADSVISDGCSIGQNTIIGSNSRLDSNVTVYHNCRIGDNVIIQACTVIGSTGFGYSFIDGSHRLVPHNGGVVIEDFVEIGANTCVDRGKFGNTVIGAGTKIDNLVQIAHNVTIGKCCLIVSEVGISGSVKIGNGVVLAGQVGVVDNVEIGDGVIATSKAGITKNVKAGTTVFGRPAVDIKEGVRMVGFTRRLPEMAEQLKKLARKVEALELAENDKNRR